MKKHLYSILFFVGGLILGWLNPIEGPLDWTYDEYASKPAHKYPTKAAPIQKEDKSWFWGFFEEYEEEDIPTVIQTMFEE